MTERMRNKGKKIFFSLAMAYSLFVLTLAIIFVVVKEGTRFLPDALVLANEMLIMSSLLPPLVAPFAMMSFFEMPHGILFLAYLGLIVCLRKFSVPFLQYKVLVPLIFLWLLYGLFCVATLY